MSNKWSSFWYRPTSNPDRGQMAKVLRSIKDFPTIVLGYSVPVTFKGDDSYTDGNSIVIGSDNQGELLDVNVGVALHEASHIKYTKPEKGFEVLKSMQVALTGNDESGNAVTKTTRAHNLDVVRKEFGISKSLVDDDTLIKDIQALKSLINITEDRRIDNLMFNEWPGYRGYYDELYNHYFRSDKIAEILKSKEARTRTWGSYITHILGFLHAESDASVLPGLDVCEQLMDMPNYGSHCKKFEDAAKLAGKLYATILPNIDRQQQKEEDEKNAKQRKSSGSGARLPMTRGELQDALDKALGRLEGDQDSLTGEELSEEDISVIKRILSGEIKPYSVDRKGNATCTTSDSGDEKGGGAGGAEQAVFIKQIADAGTRDLLGMSSAYSSHNAVAEGIKFGKMLAKKLHIRHEEHVLKTTRLQSGKVSRRLLAGAGYGYEDIFENVQRSIQMNHIIHMSIDTSGSMAGAELFQAVKTAVAIAYAAAQVPGIRVQISCRSTASLGAYFAMVYDSAIHDVAYIKKYLPYIKTTGGTPDGLAYTVWLQNMPSLKGYQNAVFISLTDGEPSGHAGYDGPTYAKMQLDKMRRHGWQVRGYYISGDSFYGNGSLPHSFERQFGKDGKLIDTNSIPQLARELNRELRD